MPADGVAKQDHERIMRFEEIAEVVRVAARYGVRAVRLTGGEPLVRRDLAQLVKMIAQIEGIEDISLTTNGILLENLASDMADAGLTRVNVSLDTLDTDKFRRITRGGSIEAVWRGIDAAEKAGLFPIKINAVAMRGVNDDELMKMALLAKEHAWTVRFIELMPVKNQAPWGPDFPEPESAYISIREMMQIMAPLNLEPLPRKVGLGPAREFSLPGGLGKVGFISPVGEHFCAECNRLRLTADGNIRPCLLSDVEIPLLPALRAGEPILPILQRALGIKPEGHNLAENVAPNGRCMQQIGG
jgi:cyclic pyranopterin phosphate synthase